MSDLGGTYPCKCGVTYHAPRSLLRHIDETGHQRRVPLAMLARRRTKARQTAKKMLEPAE